MEDLLSVSVVVVCFLTIFFVSRWDIGGSVAVPRGHSGRRGIKRAVSDEFASTPQKRQM